MIIAVSGPEAEEEVGGKAIVRGLEGGRGLLVRFKGSVPHGT